MAYSVKEIFYTLQGEGAQAGRPAVFCRFSGCNLWSGREEDRTSAACPFCDTDFVGTNGVGGGKFSDAKSLAQRIAAEWPSAPVHSTASTSSKEHRFVVLTGGEPLLQVDEALTDALHAEGFTVAVETNGTQVPPPGIDWLCVSPKGQAKVVVTQGQELKLVYPQTDTPPHQFEGLDFGFFYLQPQDPHFALTSPSSVLNRSTLQSLAQANTQACIDYCRAHPQWRLSLQSHKMLGIP